MMSCTIDAREGRYIAVTAFQGLSYMQTWKKKYICYSRELSLK